MADVIRLSQLFFHRLELNQPCLIPNRASHFANGKHTVSRGIKLDGIVGK